MQRTEADGICRYTYIMEVANLYSYLYPFFYRYWCRRCQLECLHEEVVHRYCLGVTATNHTICADVVVFGGSLDSVFGASASEFHR